MSLLAPERFPEETQQLLSNLAKYRLSGRAEGAQSIYM